MKKFLILVVPFIFLSAANDPATNNPTTSTSTLYKSDAPKTNPNTSKSVNGASTTNPTGAPKGQLPAGSNSQSYSVPNTPATLGQQSDSNSKASSKGTVDSSTWHNKSGGSLYDDPNWPNTKYQNNKH